MTRLSLCLFLVALFFNMNFYTNDSGLKAETANIPTAVNPKNINFFVGAASIDITPIEPVYMGGFASRKTKSTGVRAPIFARALVLQKKNDKILWIVGDLLGFEPKDADLIRSKVAEGIQMKPEQIILSATHTHSAPAVQPIGKYKATEYLYHYLVPKLLEVSRQAISGMEECDIILVEGHSELAHDRRNDPVPGDGAAPNPDKAKAYVDYRVPAVAFRKKNGSFKAILLQYAMHPTSYSDYLIGPEWPGATADALQKNFGESVVPFVLQGGGGNLGSPKRKATDQEMQSWGEELANSVTDRIRKGTPVKNAPFAVRSCIIPVALQVSTPEEVKANAAAKRKAYESRADWIEGMVNPWEQLQLSRLKEGTAGQINANITIVSFGEHTFVTTPFETFSHLNRELAKYIKKPVHVIGYTNGVFNYFPSADAIDQGGYEPEAHWWYYRFPTKKGALEQFAKDVAPLVNDTILKSMIQ